MSVLVIGAGLAGMVVALELAEQGIDVFLVEKAPSIGGKSINYCCKATDACNQCSTCLVLQIKTRVEGSNDIKVIANSQIKHIEGEPGSYKVTVHFLSGSRGLDLGVETTVAVAAIILAVGFDLYDPTEKGEFGYGLHKGVITSYELEKALKEHGSIEVAYGSHIKNIAFIQCVGSRDLLAGNSYCSRVCCSYTNKLAKLISYESPEIAVDVFYQDLQAGDKNCGNFNQEEQGPVRYLRSIPAKVFRYPYDYLTVRYWASSSQTVEGKYDLLVLAPAVLPVNDLQKLAGELGFGVSCEGFLAQADQLGIFAAGACTGPKNISQTISQAQAVAGKVQGFLRNQGKH
jgi:heterodisulfide reductase subunit A2